MFVVFVDAFFDVAFNNERRLPVGDLFSTISIGKAQTLIFLHINEGVRRHPNLSV